MMVLLLMRCDLIDTLWNVKLKGFPIGRTKNGDLIDTLWNVKGLVPANLFAQLEI